MDKLDLRERIEKLEITSLAKHRKSVFVERVYLKGTSMGKTQNYKCKSHEWDRYLVDKMSFSAMPDKFIDTDILSFSVCRFCNSVSFLRMENHNQIFRHHPRNDKGVKPRAEEKSACVDAGASGVQKNP